MKRFKFARNLIPYVKSRTPSLFKFFRLAYAFFYVLKTQNKILLKPTLLEHMLWCRWGEYRLNCLYASDFSSKNPLKLDILETWKIEPTISPSRFHYNPTLYVSGESLVMYWRISSYTILPQMNKYGVFSNEGLEKLENFEAIARANVSFQANSKLPLLLNEEILDNLKIVNTSESECMKARVGTPVYLEDPRAHEGEGRFITAHARFGKVGENFYRMILIDVASKRSIIIPGDDPKKSEKNWVVVSEKSNSLIMLNKGKPQILVEVEMRSGRSTRLISSESIEDAANMNLNGGSSFVLIASKFYLRVARIQLPLFPIGVARISVLVMHGLDFRELARSKPFVFNKIGVDICNGMAVLNGSIYFSWGQDDMEMFLGRCSVDELLEWFFANLQN